MDKDKYVNILIIVLDKDGIVKAGNKSSESTFDNAFDDFENTDEIQQLLLQFFIHGLQDDVVTKKISTGKEEMEFIDSIKTNETLFNKIKKIFKMLFK